jgi:hypothetical protein
MAVKIEQIDDLEHLSMKLEEYSESMKTAATEAEVTFTNKLEGSENEAVVAFVEVMNDLKSNAFAHLPEATDTFSTALQTYHSALKGAGFDNLIKSVKPIVEEDYCQEVTTTEYNKAEEKAIEIQTVINEVAAVLPEVSTSKIEEHLNTLSGELTAKTNEIKTTRSTVQSAQTSFKSQLKEVTAQLKECLTTIENVMNMTDPKAGIKPAAMAQLIQDGFGKSVVSGKLNKTDLKAMNYLGMKEYDKLFELDPNKLSSGTYSTFVAYTSKLIEKEDMTELQNFVNGLLGQIGSGSTERVEKYLEKIAEETSLQMEQVAKLQIMTYGVDIEEVNKLNEVFQLLQAGNLLWQAMYIENVNANKNIGSMQGSATLDFFGKISNLKIIKGENPNISFDLTSYQVLREASGPYVSGLKKGDKTSAQKHEKKVIGAKHFNSKDDFNKEENKARLLKIQEKQRKFVDSIIEKGTLFTAGVFCPEAAIGLEIVINLADNAKAAKSVAKGGNKAIKKLDKYISDKYPDKYKSLDKPIGWAYDLVGKSMDLWNEYKNLSAEEQLARINVLYDIIDVGGNAIGNGNGTITSLSQVLTYKQQMRLSELENHGYGSFFASIPKEEADEIRKQLASYDSKSRTWKPKSPEAAFILNGGDPMKVDIGKVEETLETAIKNAPDSKDGNPLYDKYWYDTDDRAGACHWFKERNQAIIIGK